MAERIDTVSHENSPDQSKKTKLHYPSWKSLAIESVSEARKKNPEIFNHTFRDFSKIFAKLDLVNEVIKKSDPVNLILFLSEANAAYQPQLDFETVFESFKNISVRPNEFYAVFDLYKFRHLEVDKNIVKLLGLQPEDFTLPAMAGWDPDNPLFHKRDNNHVLRWASIAYYMFTINLFKWDSMHDQYRVRFRVGMAKSSIQYFRDQEYVALEKLCFLFYDKTNDGSTKPIYHFDKWLVYDKAQFDYVRPIWISTHDRQPHLNSFLYLINAYLLDVSAQYVLYLHERNQNDRNRTVAMSINARIKSTTGIDSQIDEHQIADCFAKTIRNKMSSTMNLWDKRNDDDLIDITSDLQAVQAAKILGLLPIPEEILCLLYKNIIDL